jgi:hypothetical protein
MENFNDRITAKIKLVLSSTQFIVFKMLILGMGLYYLDMLLDGNLGIGYLTKRNCHPKLPAFTIPDVRISNYVTKDLDINYAELTKGKYIKEFQGIWGKESVVNSIWYGDEEHRVLIPIFPSTPYMAHIYAVILHVFEGNIKAKLPEICKFNQLSFVEQPDELFLHLCNRSMSRNAVETFKSIFDGLNGEEKVETFKLLKGCDISAVMDAIEEEMNVWNLLQNEEVLKCTGFIEAKHRLRI